MVKTNLNLSDRLFGAYKIVGQTFGIWRSSLLTLFFYGSLRLIVSLGQYLDRIFFPQLSKQRISKPIILVGNPRSGTTFLQRFLVEHGIGEGLELWEMLFPSLTLQKLLQPFLPLLEKISPVRHHASVAHATSLISIETDDAALFLRYLDGFFLYGYLFAFAQEDLSELFINQQGKNGERDFNWLSNIWQRNLVKKGGNRVVAKLFSLGIYLPQFLTAFPDASILYLVRDPVESIPSAMNLVTSDVNFLRIFSSRQTGFINLGLVKLKPDSNLDRVISSMRSLLPPDIKIISKTELLKAEKSYWQKRTAIGFIFNLSLAGSIIVGIVIIYQILHSNIADSLVEFATLKAIGYQHSYLLKVVFQEAIILALLGYFPGFIASLGIYQLSRNATNLPVFMDGAKALSVLAIALCITTISGAITIRKLKHTNPADIFG